MEYLQVKIGHLESIKDLKREMRGLMVDKGYNLYLNILETECYKEAGFFSNLYISIDILELRDIIEEKLQVKVGIRFKAIYRGRQVPKIKGEKQV